MGEGGGSEDYGNLLENARLLQGISRETLSRLTRIPVSTIISLENSDHYSLPQSVYVRGFIKACCSALNVDDRVVLGAYGESLRIHLRRTGPGHSSWTLSRSLGLLILLMASIFVLNIVLKGDFFQGRKNLRQGETVASADKDDLLAGDQPDVKETKVKELTLTIQGRDKSLVKLIIDGELPKKINVSSGSRFDFKARKNFNILVEDPKNIDIAFDGKPYTVSGNDQVINIFYP